MLRSDTPKLYGNVVDHQHNNVCAVNLNDGQCIDAIIPRQVARDMFRVVPGDPVAVQLAEPPKQHRIIGFAPCRYFRRYWDENAGGLCAGWGGSHFFFEVHPDGYVARQIELFDNGNRLLYDETSDEDEYGGRSTVSLDFDEYEPFSIDRAEFVNHWQPSAAVNRHT